MKINGVFSNSLINAYSDVKKKTVKKAEVEKSDSVQISSAGRSLSNLAAPENYGNSAERVEAVKKQIEQGTYSPNAKLIAQKMLGAIKGSEI